MLSAFIIFVSMSFWRPNLSFWSAYFLSRICLARSCCSNILMARLLSFSSIDGLFPRRLFYLNPDENTELNNTFGWNPATIIELLRSRAEFISKLELWISLNCLGAVMKKLPPPMVSAVGLVSLCLICNLNPLLTVAYWLLSFLFRTYDVLFCKGARVKLWDWLRLWVFDCLTSCLSMIFLLCAIKLLRVSMRWLLKCRNRRFTTSSSKPFFSKNDRSL